jgi:hypothetical protein
MGREDTATSGLVALNGNTLGNTVDVSFTVSVPIEGLAASNLVSTTETLFSSAKTQLNITSNQTVSSTSPTKIAFDSVIFDATGASDIGNSRILILKSGYYLINAHCYMNGVTSTDLMTLSIYKNGVSLYRSLDNAESATVTLTSSRVVLLAKGDYIEAFIDSQTDASYTVVGGTNDSFLEVTYQQDFSVFGVFGETAYVEAKSSTSAGWAFTSNTYGVITSIVVDPGEQVLEFSVIGQTTAANGVYDIRAAIDTVGGTSAPTLNYADNAMFDVYTNVSFEVKTLTLTGYRVNPAVATTYYLKGFVNGNISNQNLTAYKFSARKFK